MTATAVLDPPPGAVEVSASVQILPEALPALFDQAEVPHDTRSRITARIHVGDLTWMDGSDGLVVRVPPSRTTMARSTRQVRPYTVRETSCTCPGFYAGKGCYHPWVWAVIHAWRYPPLFTISGSAALTLEQPLLLAALDLVQQHAVGDLTLWLGGATLVIELETAMGTATQISLLGQGASANAATARGPVAALRALIASCPPRLPAVTLVAAPDGLTWSPEVPA